MPMVTLPTDKEDKKLFSIYLAGNFEKLSVGNITYLDWRGYFKERLSEKFPDLEFYDPREDTPQGEIAEFVSEDSFGVRESDVVFYYMTSNVGDIGAGSEITIGTENNKLTVICFGPKVGAPHPFILGKARRILIGLEMAIIYFLKLAEFGFSLDAEFKAFNFVMGLRRR
jgi:hypothetical protein